MLIARAVSDALGPLPRATAANALSAASTAAACGVLAWLFGRWTGSRAIALATALCAGAMSTVWLNATETEVYAVSLLLVSLILLAANQARESGRWHWVAVTAYAIALAVPLHLGALVVVPAAVVLVAQSPDGTIRWSMAGTLSAVGVLVLAVGLASPPMVAAAVGAVAAAVASQRREHIPSALGTFAVALIAFSALAYLPVRSAFDPEVNWGDPSGWSATWELVGRRQYGSHALWPRQAPAWLQLANLAQYLDWQVALGLAPGVAPSWRRTAATVGFGALAALGSAAHRRTHAASWLAYLTLVICGTVGLVAYLNFRAGASLGYGVLPDSTPHEVRERDYFFAVGFWSLGGWAGFGAVELVRRLAPRAAVIGIALAAMPVLLNWRAVDRRREPMGSLARESAAAFLSSVPQRAVLISWGDNDSFPLWYLQVVEGMRRDVSIVVAPLLGTRWYRAQLVRRDSLLSGELVDAQGRTVAELVRAVAQAAERRGRPIAMSVTVPARHRDQRGRWVLRGLAYVRDDTTSGHPVASTGIHVDSAIATQLAALRRRMAAAALEPSTDPTARYMVALLGCAASAVAASTARGAPISLDSRCNFR